MRAASDLSTANVRLAGRLRLESDHTDRLNNHRDIWWIKIITKFWPYTSRSASVWIFLQFNLLIISTMNYHKLYQVTFQMTLVPSISTLL